MKELIDRIYRYFFYKKNSPEALLEYYKSKGVKVGEGTVISTSGIDASFGPLLEIGKDCSIAPNVTILLHDASTKRYLGYTKIEKVYIGNMCFIASGCIILPGTRIGDNCIIGAGSVVRGEVPENSVLLGNPAQVVGKTKHYIRMSKNSFDESLIYDDTKIEDLYRASRELKGTGFVL